MRLSLAFAASRLTHELVFRDVLPAALPLPDGWKRHIHLIEEMGLPPPKNAHALDRSVAWVVLLEEVEFDLNTSLVTCRFLNGFTTSFPLSPKHASKLASIPDAYARARRQTTATHAANYAARRQTRPGAYDEVPLKNKAHQTLPTRKRNKLVKPRPSLQRKEASEPYALPVASSVPPSPTPQLAPSPLSPSPRTFPAPSLPPWFRRTTRPTLIDTYRLAVAPALSAAFWCHHGAAPEPDARLTRSCGPHYALWTVRSVVRQIGGKIEQLEWEERVGEEEEEDVGTPGLGCGSDSDTEESVRTPLEAHGALPPVSPGKKSSARAFQPLSPPPPPVNPNPNPNPNPTHRALHTAHAHFSGLLRRLERTTRLDMLEEIGAVAPEPELILARILASVNGGERRTSRRGKGSGLRWEVAVEEESDEDEDDEEWRALEGDLRAFCAQRDDDTASVDSTTPTPSRPTSPTPSAITAAAAAASRRRCVALRATDAWEEGVVNDVRRRVSSPAAGVKRRKSVLGLEVEVEEVEVDAFYLDTRGRGLGREVQVQRVVSAA